MKIIIQLGESLKSPHDGKVLLPQIRVTSSMSLSVYGLYDNKPSMLELKRGDTFFEASYFLHENITSHIHTGNFNLFITNTRNFIGCLATNEMIAFTTTLESNDAYDRDVRISDMMIHDFIIIEEEQKVIIEPLYVGNERETDKHVSI